MENNSEFIANLVETLELHLNSGDKQTVICGDVFLNTILIPKYINLKQDRLKSMFKWLSENYRVFNNRFPAIPDFEQAKRETSSYTADTSTKYKDVPQAPDEIVEAVRDVLSSFPSKPTKSIPKPKKHSHIALYRQMVKEGKVFDVSNGKWVDKNSKIEGNIVDPAISLKKIDSN